MTASPAPEIPVWDQMFDAIDDAYAAALAAHENGSCVDSEWSCSHCEAGR